MIRINKIFLLSLLAVNSVCASEAIVGLEAFALLSDSSPRDQMICHRKKALREAFIGKIEFRHILLNGDDYHKFEYKSPLVHPLLQCLLLQTGAALSTRAVVKALGFNEKNSFSSELVCILAGSFLISKVGSWYLSFYIAQQDEIRTFFQNNGQLKRIHISYPQ